MEIETTKEGIVKIKKVKDHIILESKNGNKIGVEFNKKGFVIGYKGKRYDVKDDLISLLSGDQIKNVLKNMETDEIVSLLGVVNADSLDLISPQVFKALDGDLNNNGHVDELIDALIAGNDWDSINSIIGYMASDGSLTDLAT